MKLSIKKIQKGFTLIELLVVIAIIGILAAVVLVAVNPTEQLARGRDASKLSTVSGLGKAVQSYYTSQQSAYPPNATWLTALTTSGEIKQAPTAPATGACPAVGPNVLSGYCFNTNATPDAVIFAQGESTSNRTKASCGATDILWIVWSSAAGKAGFLCTANITTYPIAGVTILF